MIRSHLIRSATLSGYAKAAGEVGLDAGVMLKKAGLQPACLQDPDVLISQHSLVKLLEISAQASGHHDFGSRAAIARGVPDLGAVSLLLREAETVGDALQMMISRLHLHGEGVVISVDNDSDAPFISFRVSSPPDITNFQATEFCVCGFVQVVRWLIGSEWKPQRVCFSHPSLGPAQLQRAFFKSPVWYDQTSSGVLVDRWTLSREVETSSPFLRRQAWRYLNDSIASKPLDFPSRVCDVIAQLLPRSSCSVDDVALVLGIHRRTLARRLERNNLSFSLLLQRTRCEVARQIAGDPRLSLTDAAEATGFQALSSFSRWFRASFGCSATQWRQAANQPARPLRTQVRADCRSP